MHLAITKNKNNTRMSVMVKPAKIATFSFWSRADTHIDVSLTQVIFANKTAN